MAWEGRGVNSSLFCPYVFLQIERGVKRRGLFIPGSFNRLLKKCEKKESIKRIEKRWLKERRKNV